MGPSNHTLGLQNFMLAAPSLAYNK